MELCDLEREEAQSAMTTAPARMQMKARIGVDLETLNILDEEWQTQPKELWREQKESQH